MSRVTQVLIAIILSVLAIASPKSASFDPPMWAYPAVARGFKPDPDDGKPKRLPGSSRMFTYAQIEDSFAPADWYPGDHPRMPDLPVARGRKPDVRACSWCHLPNGMGHPQSAGLAGLSAEYLALQVADFKSGDRHSSVGFPIMVTISRGLTPEETKAAADYFAQLGRRQWIKVVESAMSPKTRIIEGNLRIPLGPEEMEPLGERIVEVPQDPERTRIYDSHAGFVAYVPPGSVKRGRDFVATGGATIVDGKIVAPGKAVACATCHGTDLRGMAHAIDRAFPAVPGLTGRSPTYIVRQLYDFHSGGRSGRRAMLMKPIAAQMTLREMIDVAAYIGSLAP